MAKSKAQKGSVKGTKAAYKMRDVALEQAFDPKRSRVRRIETADDAFADDGEDECTWCEPFREAAS